MEDRKIKHLEMIENVIQRMAGNCFQLKGWTVALIGFVTVFFSSAKAQSFLGVVIFLIMAFWYMDSYYLCLEKKYRILYDNVCKKTDNKIDFNMDIKSIELDEAAEKQVKLINCILSDSEIGFYGPITFATIILQRLF